MSTDLLDFFAAPTVNSNNKSSGPTSNQSAAVTMPMPALPSSSNQPVTKRKSSVESSEESASDETFDFTSGLKKGDCEAQSNFGHVDDDDAWDTLAQRNPNKSSAASQANKEFKISPDSFLYKFNKEVEKFGDKINASVADSQKSIDRFDAKHGVTQKVLKKIEKYDLSHRLDVVGSDLTDKADKLSADLKDLKVGEKVKKGVKQAKKKLKLKKKSGKSSSDSSEDEAERTKEKQKRKQRLSDASKSNSGQFISIGAQDRIPGPDDSSYSEMSGNEMTPRKSQQAVVDSFNKAFSKEKPKINSTSSTSSSSSNGSSSLTYQPKSSAASRSNGIAPPPPAPSALFAMPAGLRAHEEEEEEEDDTQEPPLSPLSFSTPSSTSHANSREHSFNFNSLRFDDVHLSDREH